MKAVLRTGMARNRDMCRTKPFYMQPVKVFGLLLIVDHVVQQIDSRSKRKSNAGCVESKQLWTVAKPAAAENNDGIRCRNKLGVCFCVHSIGVLGSFNNTWYADGRVHSARGQVTWII
jgi:hypothetical protein